VSWRWDIGLLSSVFANAVAYTIRGGFVGKSNRISACPYTSVSCKGIPTIPKPTTTGGARANV
jgi:hypothetical protein